MFILLKALWVVLCLLLAPIMAIAIFGYLTYSGFVENNGLRFFAFLLPFCFFGFYICLLMLSTCLTQLEFFDDYFIVRKFFFRKIKVYYIDIHRWDGYDPYPSPKMYRYQGFTPDFPSITIERKGKRKITVSDFMNRTNFLELQTKLKDLYNIKREIKKRKRQIDREARLELKNRQFEGKRKPKKQNKK